LGLNWVCFFAKSSFLGEKRIKLGSFCKIRVVIGQPVFATFADGITFLDGITGLTRFIFIHDLTPVFAKQQIRLGKQIFAGLVVFFIVFEEKLLFL
jgi:hypothetical protein